MSGAVAASILQVGGVPIQPYNPDSQSDAALDRNWARVAFMVSANEIDDIDDIKNQYYSSADTKFVDTRLGCNIGVNPRPQWTRYSDIRVKGRLAGRHDVSLTNEAGNYGMGRAYSENIDDPAQKIFLSFGVPKFSGLLNFLTRAFDREATMMARTGRPPSFWYNAARTISMGFATFAVPALGVPILAGKAINYFFSRPTSKFFTIKDTMFLYWSSVNQLVNNHAVNSGIYKQVLANQEKQRLGKPYEIDEDQMKTISALMPDVFGSAGYIDVYAMCNRAQRMANQMFEADYARLDAGTAEDFYGYLKRDSGTSPLGTYISTPSGSPTLAAMLKSILSFGDYYVGTDDSKQPANELDPRIDPEASDGKQITDGGHVENMKKYMDALYRDGASWAVFRVDYTGSVGEAFANSTVESDLAQKFNNISSGNKEARFSLQDGNILGETFQAVVGAVTSVATGILDGVTFGLAGITAGLGGSGYLDVPKHWQSSSANLPRGSYTIQLRSPYRNPISEMINVWIPFYMLLAGAIPRSTGKQSYTSPFYCQLFDRGRLQSRTAMIEQLRVTRGVSNLGFDLYGHALGIDVSFDVVELSSIAHMPMSSGGLTETDMTLDEDNIMMDYLNVLAGMDIYSQVYAVPKAQLKATKKLLALKQKATSPAFHAAVFKNSIEDGFINDITLGASGLVSSIYQGLQHGNALLEGDRT